MRVPFGISFRANAPSPWMADSRSSNHSLSFCGGGDGTWRAMTDVIRRAPPGFVFDLVFVDMDQSDWRQQAIDPCAIHQGLESSNNALSSASLFAPSSVSAASAVSSASTALRVSPPATGVKSTTKVPHDSWPTTASHSAPSLAAKRRISGAPRAQGQKLNRRPALSAQLFAV